MNILVCDIECDTYNKGNPFDPRNKLVCVAQKTYGNPTEAWLWPSHKEYIQDSVDTCDLVVGFNFKFDYHWLHNNGVDLSGKRIWDCQAAHYILSHQAHIFPSLNDVLSYYGFEPKLDVVKLEYWDRGITTSDIPFDVLGPYAIRDVEGTYQVFLKQWEACTPAQRALVLLDGQDMHVLREMEANGLQYDYELCKQRAEENQRRIWEILLELDRGGR